MARKRRSFSGAFKAKVALAACRGDKTTAQLAAEFEVHAGQVTAWKKQLLEGAAGLFEDGRSKRAAEDAANEEGKRSVQPCTGPVRPTLSAARSHPGCETVTRPVFSAVRLGWLRSTFGQRRLSANHWGAASFDLSPSE